MSKDYYYGCVTSLAWILGHYFYGRKHFVWLAAEYYPYRLLNPKSSNPHLIYQDIYQPWKDSDVYDKFISQLRLNLRKGVIVQENAGVLTAADAGDLKNICDKVDIVFFYPIVYRVDINQIPTSRRSVSGSGSSGSSEYLVKDLDESEFEILFIDFDSDSDFKTLVVDERAGSSTTSGSNAMSILENRC
jgi:hypothetical protein